MQTEAKAPPEAWISMRVAHLQMLQGAVERMSASSGNVKVASTGIVTAISGLAATTGSPSVAAIAVPVIILLAGLDGYYLKLERDFRLTFNEVRQRPIEELPTFELTSRTKASFLSPLLSLAVWPFHLGLLLLAFLTFLAISSAGSSTSMAEIAKTSAIGSSTVRDQKASNWRGISL